MVSNGELMKTWYIAVCDKCGEATHVMVNNPNCTQSYLGDESRQIQQWLTKHYGCELRLIWRDDQLDELWDSGWESVGKVDGINMYIK